MARILIWDIETTDLKSDWGVLLCVGYKWLDEKETHVISITDYPSWQDDFANLNDKNVVKDFHKVLMEADMLVTFYGKGFDLPWIQGKFLEYGLPVLPSIPHVDCFWTAKSNLRLTRRNLENLTKYLKVKTKKYKVSSFTWRKAKVGNEAAIKEIADYCKNDVNATEQVYMKLRPLVRLHPRVNGFAPCRNCGGTKLQRRGIAMTTLKGERIRVQCQTCGAWENRSPQHAESAV